MSDDQINEAAETDTSDPSEPKLKPSETVDFWKQKAREQERRAKENAKAREELDEMKAAQLTEVERLQQERDDARAKLSEFERTALVQEVALEKGLPAKWISRLRGDDKDSLLADAEEILADLVKDDANPSPGVHVPGEGHSPSAMPLNGDGLENALRSKLGM